MYRFVSVRFFSSVAFAFSGFSQVRRSSSRRFAAAESEETHEAGVFGGLRWWTLPELEATDEEFAPADLPGLVRRLVEQDPPERPSRSASSSTL
ncbi:MAG: hypothetical protein H0V18_19125 [Pyrinomonadaceae bacterium]|nr:hypothetical protein [Pyrinomonadaceae bacterium]